MWDITLYLWELVGAHLVWDDFSPQRSRFSTRWRRYAKDFDPSSCQAVTFSAPKFFFQFVEFQDISNRTH